MKGLILDTSSNRPFLLLAEEGRPLDFAPLESGANLSKELGAHIKKFLRAPPSFIAIGTGPGSYTGVRVGVAMAKALAFGWQIPLLGFPSLQCFAPPSQATPFAILADAGMGGLYCQRSSEKGEFLLPERLSASEAPKILAGIALFSPQSSSIAKRAVFPQGVADAEPNLAYLSNFCCQAAPERGSDALAPFPLAYLDGKP